MESSPLRFLDLDVSLMLAGEVRNSQEEEARVFHDNLFENSHEINLNWEHHYLMAHIFEEVGYLLDYPVIPKRKIYVIKGRFFRDTKVANILDFKRCYDVSILNHIENTRLQRCGYNH